MSFVSLPPAPPVKESNVTIQGNGTIDGNGWYWYPFFHNVSAAHHIGRPHLVELNNCTNVEITGVTLKDSAFWTLHPVYCKDVYIHHMRIVAPSCRMYKCANTDGIDVDSSEDVLIEHNYISVGDDHVTVIAGKRPGSPKSRNVTVQHNELMSGMGLAIGSSTAGGISDVLYYNNVMTQQVGFQKGQGVHIKLRDRFGGYVRNIAWIDNVFYAAGLPGGAIRIEAGYQPGNEWKMKCDATTCTEVRNILIRNLTIHRGWPGELQCYAARPCQNITFDNVRFLNAPKTRITCANVASGRAINTGKLFEKCPNLTQV